MEYLKTDLEGVVVCVPKVYNDKRGYFVETYVASELNLVLGYDVEFIQDNEAKSTFGVVRGLHFQKGNSSQAKLLRVIKGEVLDVVVDLRKDSKTFGKSYTRRLNDITKEMLFVPRGFAHGYAVLSDEAIVAYKVDNLYDPESESGLLYNDPELNIDWGLGVEERVLSEKDIQNPKFKEVYKFEKDFYV